MYVRMNFHTCPIYRMWYKFNHDNWLRLDKSNIVKSDSISQNFVLQCWPNRHSNQKVSFIHVPRAFGSRYLRVYSLQHEIHSLLFYSFLAMWLLEECADP